jgi:hypothetical protein
MFDVRLLSVTLRAYRDIFAHGHRHRSCNKSATPATKITPCDAEDAATPIMRLAVDTIGSSEPSTAARNQPTRPLQCISTWSA